MSAHIRLLDAGIPVIVCRPNPAWKPGSKVADVIPASSGWAGVTVEQARKDIAKYRPGVDTLAMVGGHGIDVLDLDTKFDGVTESDLPDELKTYGRTMTPSGGFHFPVPSTGHAKGSLKVAGKTIGDYVGGTVDGGSRLLAYLPGSSRPKYHGAGYVELVEWDIVRLLEDEPSPMLLGMLDDSNLSRDGAAGKPAAARTECTAFLADHSGAATCRYGAATLRARIDEAPSNDRHPWFIAALCRIVELMRSGCLNSSAYEALVDKLDEIKPEGGTDAVAALAWAIANTDGASGCSGHDTEPPPDSRDRNRVSIETTNAAEGYDSLADQLGTGATSGVFARNGELFYTPSITEDGWKPTSTAEGSFDSSRQIRKLTPHALAGVANAAYLFVRRTKTGDLYPVLPPLDYCTRLCAFPEAAPGVRALRGVSATPYLRRDFSVADKPGYDATSGVAYLPPPGYYSLPVPSSPSPSEIAAAAALILRMLSGFPFNSDDDRANYVAALLWPLMLRAAIPGTAPAVGINAHQPASGKTLLARILVLIHDGTQRSEFPATKEEIAKEIAATLATNIGMIVFDNVRGVVKSGELEAILTTRDASVRRLGKNDETLSLTNDRVWIFTGNNLAIGGDLARRFVWVNIDPNTPNPEMRTGFAIDDLPLWVQTNRAKIVAALLTLVRAWVSAGKSRKRTRTDGFADAIEIAQAVLDLAGIPGTIASKENAPVSGVAHEDDEWTAWYEAIFDKFGTKLFKAKELMAAIDEGARTLGQIDAGAAAIHETLPSDLVSRMDSRAGLTGVALGKFLGNRAGRYFGDLRLDKALDRKTSVYALARYKVSS